MTDDELRKLAEAALEDEERHLAHEPAPEWSVRGTKLARAVLRLLEEKREHEEAAQHQAWEREHLE